MLASYIYQTYVIEISHVTIWLILKANNLSYKRAQAKPTKANKSEQEAFKKTLETLNTLESLSNVAVYALDETSVSVESDSHSSWSPVGIPRTLEKNASHDGINIVGSTCILNYFHTVNDVYSKKKINNIRGDKVPFRTSY